jgi:xylulokinase
MLTMSLGTSGTLFSCADRPVVDRAGGWAAFCSSSGSWLPLICTMNCTVATERIARTFGFDARDGDSVMAGTVAGAAGLTLLPFFNGERTPDLPLARASLQGVDLGNFTQGNVYRAAMEGATFALRYGFDALRAANLSFSAIRLTGGGSRSGAWRQMVADVFDLPVDVPAEPEGAALGAALHALWASETAGAPGDLVALTRDHVKIEAALGAQPSERSSADYASAYHRFLEYLRIEMQLRPSGTADTGSADSHTVPDDR